MGSTLDVSDFLTNRHEKSDNRAMPEAEASCAFCGKTRHQVRDLIARRKTSSARICEGCLSICRDILDRDSLQPVQGPVYSVRAAKARIRAVEHCLRCSFCGRPQDYVRKLISAPRERAPEFICGRCVARSLQILKGFDQPRSAPWIYLRRVGQFFTGQPARLHRLP
jgi:ribosomal protein S14